MSAHPPGLAVDQPPSSGETATRRTWAWVAMLATLALALRLVDLGGKSLWFDEALSINDALDPYQGFGSGFHPPLYYLVLKTWMAVFGQSEAATRLTAALPGALTVPAVYLLGRRLFGHRAGLAAGLLLCFASLHVEYSQEVRMYALATMFGSFAVLALAEGVLGHDRRPKRQWALAAAFTLFAVAAALTHYLMVTVLGAALVVLLLSWSATRAFAARVLALQIPAVILASGVAFALGYTRAMRVAFEFATTMRGVNQTLFPDPARQAARLPIDLFLQVLPGPSLKWLVIASYEPLAIALFDLIAIASIILLVKRSGQGRFAAALPTVCWLAPALFTLFLTGAGQLRFFIPSSPFLYVAIGGGLGLLARREAYLAILGALLVPSALACWWYFDPGMDKQPWREVGQSIAREAREGDTVIVTEPHLRLAFDRYYRPGPGVEVFGFPEGGTVQIDEENLKLWFVPLVRDARRVWYVRMSDTASHSDPKGLAPAWLQRSMRPVFTRRLRGYNGDVELSLYERGPGS